MKLQVQQSSLVVNLSNEIEGKVYVEGKTLEDLANRLRAYVDEVGMGARDMSSRFGDVTQGGRNVARITYNGTVVTHLGS